MPSATLTITPDGAGGTAKVLALINGPTNGVTEYFLDETLVQWKATVKHSSDVVKAGTQAFDRHTVTFDRYVKPVAPSTIGSRTQVIMTLRNDPAGVSGDMVDLFEAMSFWSVKAGGEGALLLNKNN